MHFLRDVYEEHLDEAAFLWTQWERALAAPDRTLADTETVEERLLAHLDALVVGGAPVAEALLLPALESEEPTRLSAALWALLAQPDVLKTSTMEALLGTLPGELRSAAQRALELSGRRDLPGVVLQPWQGMQEAPFVALALDVLAFRREVSRPPLERLSHPDGQVVAAALRGLWPLPPEVEALWLARLLKDPRPGVADAALEAGLVSGAGAAWEACRARVTGAARAARLPMVVLALGGERRDLELLVGLLGREDARADALWALGFSGRREAAEACLELMGERRVAPLAAEAFSAITGLEWAGPYVLPREEPEELPPLVEDLSQDLEPRPEDALPVPAQPAVAAWWKEARQRFSEGKRYLWGREFGPDVLLDALEQGPMWRRPVLALELAWRSQGACLVQTRAFTHQQRTVLG
ncbi:TIGR02270 family protein, partial [Corallococcus llansteffanensis]